MCDAREESRHHREKERRMHCRAQDPGLSLSLSLSLSRTHTNGRSSRLFVMGALCSDPGSTPSPLGSCLVSLFRAPRWQGSNPSVWHRSPLLSSVVISDHAAVRSPSLCSQRLSQAILLSGCAPGLVGGCPAPLSCMCTRGPALSRSSSRLRLLFSFSPLAPSPQKKIGPGNR